MDTLVLLLRRSLNQIDEKWPSVKYISLGLYSAWILLIMSGTSIVSMPEYFESSSAQNMLYLVSGVPLASVLLLCGVFHKHIGKYIVHGPLVPIMGLLASLCTAIILGLFGNNLPTTIYLAANAGTGVGTAFVALRVGHIYSSIDSNRIFFTVFFSAVLANFVFFMCSALSEFSAKCVLASLPFFAILLCFIKSDSEQNHDSDRIPIEMLPKGFFLRCALIVFIFALTIGIMKTVGIIQYSYIDVQSETTTSVFASLNLKLVLLLAFALCLGVRHFDIGKIYYPITIIACLIIIVTPLLGDNLLRLQFILINVLYNLFILTIWCILSSIASQTTLPSVFVFGVGRGASAAGTTLGQLIAGFALVNTPDLYNSIVIFAVALAVVVLICTQFVMSEKTVSEALDKTFEAGVIVVPDSADNKDGSSNQQEYPLERWDVLCNTLAEAKGLTPRETEIMALLSRGRTASYIAEELCISYNTAKGHVRNLYNKCEVHSRQELINLIEAQQK